MRATGVFLVRFLAFFPLMLLFVLAWLAYGANNVTNGAAADILTFANDAFEKLTAMLPTVARPVAESNESEWLGV